MNTAALRAHIILPDSHKSASLSVMRAMLSTLGAPVSANTGTALSDATEQPQTASPNFDSMWLLQLVLTMSSDFRE